MKRLNWKKFIAVLTTAAVTFAPLCPSPALAGDKDKHRNGGNHSKPPVQSGPMSGGGNVGGNHANRPSQSPPRNNMIPPTVSPPIPRNHKPERQVPSHMPSNGNGRMVNPAGGRTNQPNAQTEKPRQPNKPSNGNGMMVIPSGGPTNRPNAKTEKPRQPNKPSNGNGITVIPPGGSMNKPNAQTEKPRHPKKPSNGNGMTVIPPSGSTKEPNRKSGKPIRTLQPSNGFNMPPAAAPPVNAPGNPQTPNPGRGRPGGGRSGRGSSDHTASAFLVGVGLGVGLMALASNQDSNGDTNCPPYVPTYPGLDGNSPLSGGGNVGYPNGIDTGSTTLGGPTTLGNPAGGGLPGSTGPDPGLSNTILPGPDSVPPYFRDGPDGSNSNEDGPVSIADSLLVQGEESFRSGDYQEAASVWKQAIAEAPQSGIMWMMLGQALFANGEHVASANVTRHAMQMLPEDQWGVVVQNYSKLYYTDSTTNDYVEQLKSLEEARTSHPDAASLRFLLGFHYGYLGYRTEAVRELDKMIELGSNDERSRKLRDEMAR